MKILLVVSSYRPNLGGLQSVTSNLAAALKQRGHSLSILTNRYPRALAACETVDGIRVTRWHFITPRWRHLLGGRFELFFAGLIYFPITLARLVLKVALEKPDVVNLHFVGAPALFVTLARSVMHFHYVVTVHGNDVESLFERKGFDRWIFQFALAQADVVTAPSQYLLDRARLLVPNLSFEASVIHNSIDSAEVMLGGNETDGLCEKALSYWMDLGFVASIGRLVRVKGIDILLDALCICKHEGEQIRLILIGDGPERAPLESRAHELNLDSQLVFAGALPHAKVVSIMKASRFIIVPSRAESFGLVALEAMACSKAVVATRSGGIPEVVKDGETGLLVQSEDAIGLAQAISMLWNDQERSAKMGKKGFERAMQEFDIHSLADKYLQAYGMRNI